MAIILVIGVLGFSMYVASSAVGSFVYALFGAAIGFDCNLIVSFIQRVESCRRDKHTAVDAIKAQIISLEQSALELKTNLKENVLAKQAVTLSGLGSLAPWWVLAGKAGLAWLPKDERQLLDAIDNRVRFVISLVVVIPQSEVGKTGLESGVTELARAAGYLATLLSDIKTKI